MEKVTQKGLKEKSMKGTRGTVTEVAKKARMEDVMEAKVGKSVSILMRYRVGK